MARFYANENFPLPVVETLRQLGHDVLTIQETGRADQATPDEQVLAFAQAEKRVLLTFNRKHFIQLHHLSPDHTGIIVCTFDPNFTALAHRVHDQLGPGVNVSGQLIRVNRPQSG